MVAQGRGLTASLVAFVRRLVIALVICGGLIAVVAVRDPVETSRGDGSWTDAQRGALLFPTSDSPEWIDRALIDESGGVKKTVSVGYGRSPFPDRDENFSVDRADLTLDPGAARRVELIRAFVEGRRESFTRATGGAVPFEFIATAEEIPNGVRYRVRHADDCTCWSDAEYIVRDDQLQLVRLVSFNHRGGAIQYVLNWYIAPIASAVSGLVVALVWTSVVWWRRRQRATQPVV